MTKTFKNPLIGLLMLVMTVCLGFALLGTQLITANAATAEYGLWVGGVKVTSDNLVIDGEDNNAITGSATYDPTSNTLTLDNFSYTSVGKVVEGAILCDNSIDSLNIVLKGTNTISVTGDDWGNSDCGIILEKDNATLRISDYVGDDSTGVLNITSDFYGIKFNGGNTTELTLVNVTLNIDTYWPGIAAARNVSITKSTLMIQTGPKANYTAFYQLNGVNFSNGAENYNVYNSNSPTTPVTTDKTHYSTYLYKYVKIEPVEGTPYDVWVAGIQFDSRNLTIDSNDNNAVTGSATYDPTSNTLTLDNFSYTGAGYSLSGTTNILIYSTGSDLKIVLKGTNKLVGTGDYKVGIIIEDGSLTIASSDEYSDTASLELTVDDMCIYAYGSLSIENAKLTTTTTDLPTSSTTVAIYTEGDLSITSSEITVIAGDSDGDGIIEYGSTIGIMSYGKATITDSSVNVAANDCGIDADSDMTIDNSTVIIDGGIYGTSVADTFIKNSTVTISGEIAISTNTMYGGDLWISNSNVEMSAQKYAIYDWYYYEPLAYYELNDLTGHVIYVGEDKESATLLTEIPEDVFENKYLRFAPASSVTVNYGIDGVDNKEFKIEKGTTLSLENPEIDGYAFIGWYNEDTLETAFDFSTPINDNITIYAKWAVAYDIWVAGIRLNAENFIIDNEDDASISGSATYDAVNNILTLNNFIYESAGDYRGNNDYAPIRVKDGTTIEVVGEKNDIACNGTTDDDYYAIYGLGSLTIIGNGDTDVLYTHGFEGGGIYSSGILTIQNLELKLYAKQSAIHSKKSITLDKVSGLIYSGYQDGIYVSDPANRVNIFNCNLLIESYGKGITVNSSVVYFKNSFVEIVSDDRYALWDTGRSATAYVSYPDKHFVFAGWYEDEVEEVDPYDANSFENNYVKIVPTRKITLNFSSVGLPSEEVFVIANEPAIIETPVIDGYVFIGWYNEDALENTFDFSAPITENITLYAKFANYTQDMADINSQISSVQSSIATLETNLAKKVDATTLATNVTDLQAKINELSDNYQSADATQQAEINALKTQVENLISDTLVVLNGKVTDIESEIADINDSILANGSDITANAGSIATLTTDLSALKGVVDALDNTYVNNTELDSLKASLESADSTMNALIATLNDKVTDIEAEIADINDSILANGSDITANAGSIATLTTDLSALKGVVDALDNTYVNNTELDSLKASLESADAQINSTITELVTKVNKTESDIANLVSNKADVTVVNEKIGELKGLIDALDAVKNNYATADEELKTNIIQEIEEAQQTAISSATALVNNAKAELNTAIATKADTATLNAKVDELNVAIETAETVAKNYTDGKASELTTAIATAKTEAINSAKDLVDKAKAELNTAIATKADASTVSSKFNSVESAIAILQGLSDDYVAADTELKQDLTETIATAKTEAINSAKDLVNNAKEELNVAIATKADASTVNSKFNSVESAIAILQGLSDDYVAADTELKGELTALINSAKTEIVALITAGDKANADALEAEISKLRAEIEDAKSSGKALPIVIASIAIAGDIALLLWLILKRKILK